MDTEARYEPARARALFAVLMLAISAIGAGLSMVVLHGQIAVLQALASRTAGVAEAEANDALVRTVEIARLGLLVMTAAAFIAWMHRAYKNVPALGGMRRWGDGAAISAWFIPFVNFVRPYQVMCEIARASLGRVPGLVGAWWTLFIAGNIVDNIASRMASGFQPTVSELTTMTWGLMLGDVLRIVAAALAIATVLAIDAGQARSYRPETDGAAAPPTAF